MKKKIMPSDVIAKMRCGERHKDIDDYEKKFGPFPEDFRDSVIYKKYIGHFQIPSWLHVVLPAGYEDCFDWELFLQLVFSSFSSQYHFMSMPNQTDRYTLYIKVETNDVVCSRRLDELMDLQVETMFEIYFSEQIQLFLIDECAENDTLDDDRERILQKYSSTIHNLVKTNYYNDLYKQLKKVLES